MLVDQLGNERAKCFAGKRSLGRTHGTSCSAGNFGLAELGVCALSKTYLEQLAIGELISRTSFRAATLNPITPAPACCPLRLAAPAARMSGRQRIASGGRPAAVVARRDRMHEPFSWHGVSRRRALTGHTLQGPAKDICKTQRDTDGRRGPAAGTICQAPQPGGDPMPGSGILTGEALHRRRKRRVR
jgi:hypothetical protein